MFRLFGVPAIIGIVITLVIYFLLAKMISEADVVAYFGSAVLNLSNALFATMPQLLADYVAGLNLLIVAITAGLLVMIIIQLFILVGAVLLFIPKAIISLLKRDREPVKPEALQPLELDDRYKGSPKGKDIAGRSFDSIERD